MALGLIGRKLGMTQIYTAAGELVPVTVIQAGPCTVLQAKTVATDGYVAVQVGFEAAKPQRLTKAVRQHCVKANKGVFKILREFRLDDGAAAMAPGDELLVEQLFKQGDTVDITGITKGRGYTGVIKRHGFSGFPGSHGTHEYFRHGGSIGNRSYPGRVFKNKRMAGQYGNDRVTTQNIEVVSVRAAEHLLLVRGAVPGSRGGVVVVRAAVKAKTHG